IVCNRGDTQSRACPAGGRLNGMSPRVVIALTTVLCRVVPVTAAHRRMTIRGIDAFEIAGVSPPSGSHSHERRRLCKQATPRGYETGTAARARMGKRGHYRHTADG